MTLTKSNKSFLKIAIILIATGIMLGAFGAHSLKTLGVLAEKITSWKTGVFYQIFQGLGILLLVILSTILNIKTLTRGIRFILIGSLLFSISIYMLTLNSIWNITILKYIMGPATPIGGLLMIIGWLLTLVKSIDLESKD